MKIFFPASNSNSMLLQGLMAGAVGNASQRPGLRFNNDPSSLYELAPTKR